MRNLFKKCWNDERGNALVIICAVLPLLIGSAGLATDTIQWTLWKRQLQRAADSAALAGVYTRITNDDQTAVTSAVNVDLAMNNHTGIALQSGYPVVTLPANSGTKEKQVSVTLQMAKALPFSAMFMNGAPNIRAGATAASVPGADEFCVLATDTSATSVGIEITGSTTVDIGACSLMTNSKNPNTAASNGNAGTSGSGSNSTVKAKSLAAVGGVKYSNNWNVTDYDPNSPAITDPFASKRAPSSSECTKHVTADMTKNQTYPMDRTNGVDKDTAGDIVCFDGAGGNKVGITVQGSLKLQTGVTYVINGGDLTMNSNSGSLSCGGCTVVMTNFSDPTATGNIKITGGTLDLTAPDSSTSTTADIDYKGIALFQDRRASDSGSSDNNVIQGNNGASITG
jgi:Flp pilus assembly protein TadG